MSEEKVLLDDKQEETVSGGTAKLKFSCPRCGSTKVSPIWQTLSDNRQHVTGFHCSNCDYTWKWEHKNRKAAGKNEDGILEWYQHTSRPIPIRWSIAARSAVKWKCLRSNKNWLEEQGWRISVFLSERLYIRGLTSIFFLDSQSFRTCEIVTVVCPISPSISVVFNVGSMICFPQEILAKPHSI